MNASRSYFGFFLTNSPQYKDANITNFVLAVPSKINYSPMKSATFKCNSHCYQISHLLTSNAANKERNCKYIGNTKLALIPILPILCFCKNPDCFTLVLEFAQFRFGADNTYMYLQLNNAEM